MIELLKQKTVLYAEDEPVTQALYEEYFKGYFKTVYLAKNGQEAISLYNEKKPDVIFLDINMPVVSGLEVCEYIRKEDTETKIIMLTLRSDKKTLLKAIELGLTSYLEKPMTQIQLKQLLIRLSSNLKETNLIFIKHYNHQDFVWDKVNRNLLCDTEIIHLTRNEKLLLEILLLSHHDKVDNQKIFEHIAHDNNSKEYSEASLKALLKRLRNKLPPDTIKNTYGLGYSLD